MSIIMDRNDLFGFVLGESLEHGLHVLSGYEPNSIKYYGSSNTDYAQILKDASDVSRGEWGLQH